MCNIIPRHNLNNAKLPTQYYNEAFEKFFYTKRIN